MTLPATSSTNETASAAGGHFWPRELALGLLALLVGFQVMVWFIYVPIGMSGLADFRTLYACGYMVRTGQGAEIYNSEKLFAIKEQLAPIGRPFMQAMDHPAYEALVFAPLSWLSYRWALALFMLLNVGVTGLCLWLLTPNFEVLRRRWTLFPTLLFASFFPITRAIVQGQDSIILLLLFAGALVCIQRKQDVVAGLLLGLGMFKMQIVIPVFVMFVLWRNWRFARGFAVSSIAAGLASFGLVGIRGTREYVSMLLGMSVNLKTNEDAMRYALSPLTMLNLRGIISALFEGRLSHWWVQGIIIGASIAVLVIVARCRPSLPLAAVAACLVSYHLNAQDASILIIPIAIALCGSEVWLAASGIATWIMPNAAIIPLLGFIGGIPVVMMFVIMCFGWTQDRAGLSCDSVN